MSSSPLLSQRLCAADKILNSTRDLFYHQGIRAVGVDEIVQKAGVTKPSLYRAFASKDGLATAYLADYQKCFWDKIEGARQANPDNARVQILAYFDGLAERASQPAFRGCGLTNTIVEYPDRDHAVRQEAARFKQDVRDWLVEKSQAMGARDPAMLSDGLLLLMEGAYACSQTFSPPGPAAQVGKFARILIDMQCDAPKEIGCDA